MKTLSTLALLILGTLNMNAAHADNYPLLATYDAKAAQLLAMSKAASNNDHLAIIASGTRELVSMGVSVMQLYASKNPICVQQFTVFLQELNQMENMSVDAVHTRYHDGVGLPVAPRHCYLGRSQVVHPMLNYIRLKGPFTEATRAQLVEDFEEVIEHTARIRINLDTPPQN